MNNVENVDALSSAYVAITHQLQQIEKLIRADGNAGLPIFTPHSETVSQSVARQSAIESISRVRMDSSLIKTGVVCASNKTVDAVAQLNVLKDQFKATVQSVKGGVKKSSKALQHMIQANATLTRNESLKVALRSLGELSFDLRTCYAHVRVLPENTLSVSWTWAMKHKRIVKYTVEQAFELASRMADDDAKMAAEIQLSQVPAGEILMQKVDMPPQLKANLKYLDDTGQIIKKAITVSGVLIAKQKQLPETLWRDLPQETSLRMNRPKMREEDVFIPTLGLYRYVQRS